MPGVLIVEAKGQLVLTAANYKKTYKNKLVLMTVDKARFRTYIPNCKLELNIEAVRFMKKFGNIKVKLSLMEKMADVMWAATIVDRKK